MKLKIQLFGGRGASSGSTKYKTAKTEGFGTYNKNNIPVYNGRIDYKGDFSQGADLKTLSQNDLHEAIRIQKEELEKAKSERLGDGRTRNGKMDRIFNTAKRQKYEEGIKRLEAELKRREKK